MILSFIEGRASPQAQKSWSYGAGYVLALLALRKACAFLAFPLSCLSHLSFPSILVVGPHRRLLSPGPLVTISNQHLSFPSIIVVGPQRSLLSH